MKLLAIGLSLVSVLATTSIARAETWISIGTTYNGSVTQIDLDSVSSSSVGIANYVSRTILRYPDQNGAKVYAQTNEMNCFTNFGRSLEMASFDKDGRTLGYIGTPSQWQIVMNGSLLESAERLVCR